MIARRRPAPVPRDRGGPWLLRLSRHCASRFWRAGAGSAVSPDGSWRQAGWRPGVCWPRCLYVFRGDGLAWTALLRATAAGPPGIGRCGVSRGLTAASICAAVFGDPGRQGRGAASSWSRLACLSTTCGLAGEDDRVALVEDAETLGRDIARGPCPWIGSLPRPRCWLHRLRAVGDKAGAVLMGHQVTSPNRSSSCVCDW